MEKDLKKKRLIDSVGKNVKIVLQNNFFYKGEILDCDSRSLEFLDSKTGSVFIFDLDNIKTFEVRP